MTSSRFTGTALGFYVVLAIAALLWVRWRGEAPTIVRAEDWPLDLGLGLAVGLSMVGSWSLCRRVAPRLRRLEERIRELIGPLEPAEIVLVAGASGLVEELFFRGAMLPSWGLVVSTLVFALLHTGPGPEFRAWTLFALFAGAVFGGLVLWRESLLAAIVAHATVNALQLHRLVGASGDGPQDPVADPD